MAAAAGSPSEPSPGAVPVWARVAQASQSITPRFPFRLLQCVSALPVPPASAARAVSTSAPGAMHIARFLISVGTAGSKLGMLTAKRSPA